METGTVPTRPEGPERPAARWPLWVGAVLVAASALVFLTSRGSAPSTVPTQTINLAAALLFLATVYQRTRNGPARPWRPWWAVGLLFVAGETGSLVADLAGVGPGATVADILLAAGMVALLVAGLRCSLSRPDPTTVAQMALDALVVALTTILLVWLFVVEPGLIGPAPLTAGEALPLLYPAGDLMLATFLLLVVVRADTGTRGAAGWAGTGMLAWAAGDFLFAFDVLDVRSGAFPFFFLPFWTLGYLFLVQGARRATVSGLSPAPVHRMTRGLPYLSIAVALPPVIWTVARADRVPVALLALGPVIVLILLVRQFLALHENRVLVAILAETEGHLASIVDQSTDLLLHYPLGGPIAFASPASQTVLGYPPESLVGTDALDLVHPDDRDALRRSHDPGPGASWSHEARFQRRDGSWTWIALHGRTHLGRDGRPWVLATLRDETPRREAEERRRRLERNVHVRGLINRLLVKAPDEETFLQEACDALVRTGGYRLAWIGVAEPDGAIAPVASAGDTAYLDEVQVRWDETPLGRGPSGRAVRERRPVTIRDLMEDRRYHPWRETASRHGFAASGSFPLEMGDDRTGVLNVIAGTAGVFDDAEVALLAETAGDISFGAQSQCDRRARSSAERRLSDQTRVMEAAEQLAHLGSWEYRLAEDRYLLSEETYRLFGYPVGAPLSLQDLEEALHPDDRERMLVARETLLSGGAYDETYRIVRTDGAVRWVRSQASVREGPDGPEALFGVIQDITEQKQAEETAQAAATQEREMRRLEEMAEFRAHFMNTAAHELNQPLTPLSLELGLLRSGKLGTLNEKQERAVDLLTRNLTRMSLLVQDMLDAARMQAGRLKLDRTPADVAEVVREAADTFAEQAHQEGQRLRVEAKGPLDAVIDRRRILQVVSNLVHNAIKFTPADGTIRVRAARDDGEVVISVQDTGIGLSPDQIARLFQPFVQVHDRPPKGHRGTGLGLYICKGIVEEHGGHLTVTSDGPGKGSTFTFRLPEDAP